MDSAMRRFEIQPVGGIGAWVCGSERTAASRFRSSLAVALLLGARQRRLGPGLKGAGKVGAGPSGFRSVTARFSVPARARPRRSRVAGHASCG